MSFKVDTNIKEYPILPHREQPKSSTSFASSFVQRYFLFGQNEIDSKNVHGKKSNDKNN